MDLNSRDQSPFQPTSPDLVSVESSPNHADSSASSAHITVADRPVTWRRSNTKDSTRSIHDVLRLARSRQEQETLLGAEDQADDDGCYPPVRSDHPKLPNPHQSLPVYTTIHKIRHLVTASIDDPYSAEQLKSPRMIVAVVRPLVDHLYDPDDVSVVFCLLVNRIQFQREQAYQTHHQSVNTTRANLCEMVAARILRRFDEDHEGRAGLLKLANVLVAGFEPFQNAPADIARDHRSGLHWTVRWKLARVEYQRMLTALEIAILSEAKGFLSTSACQKIVEDVYHGRIIYTPTSFIDILPDHYKNRGITLYDPRKAPLLNQYRLIVPRTRNIIENVQFAILLLLYVLTMTAKYELVGLSRLDVTFVELVFVIYAVGWNLDEMASILEHGWSVYTANLWSFLDIVFVGIFWIYVVLRANSLAHHDLHRNKMAEDVLAMAAPILLPRLAFCLMPANMLFISLRSMMADFTFLTVLACWCFGGFLLALRWLSETETGSATLPFATIAKWMLWIWFGLDGTPIQRAVEMHTIFGPALMVTFAFFGNTLFLTILVAMLSNTYTTLSRNATAEVQFRRAVITFEGVKSDAIFAYRPPFNVLAFAVLLPLKFVLTDRWFHKVNITLVRVLNAPVLLAIALYERRYLWKRSAGGGLGPGRRRSTRWLSVFGAHGDLAAVFDADPPQSVLDEIDDVDDVLGGAFLADAEDYVHALRSRRESRSVSDASAVWPLRSASNSRANASRRRAEWLDAARRRGGSGGGGGGDDQ